MDTQNLGSVNLQSQLDKIAQKLDDARDDLKKSGQATGESIGEGWEDGINRTVTKIQASSIKMTKGFKDLSQKIKQQIQQLQTTINGKNIKLNIDFSDIDINSEAFKGKVSSMLQDFTTQGMIEFDKKGSEQQFKNLITLYAKYGEKLNSLKQNYSGISVPEDALKNLQEQYALVTKIREIYLFLGSQGPVPLSGGTNRRDLAKQIEMLQSLTSKSSGKEQKMTQDYSDLLQVLSDIQAMIKPITDAFVNGETALGRMAQEGSTSLETLLGKLKELYDLMGKINDKPMAITNVFNQKVTTQMTNKAQLEIYKEQAAALLDIADKLMLAQGKLGKSDSASWFAAFKATGMDLATFLKEFSSFDAIALAGKIAGADSVPKIKTIIGTLDVYKNKLVELAKQINVLVSNNVDLSMLSKLDEFEGRLATATQQSGTTAQSTIQSGIDETEVAQIKTLRDAIDTVSKAIGRKNAGFIKEGEIVKQVTEQEISNIGDLVKSINDGVLSALDALKPKLMQAFVLPPVDQSNLQASFDLIYNKFVELKDKVGEIQFNVNAKENIPTQNDADLSKYVKKITQLDQVFDVDWTAFNGEFTNKLTGEIFKGIQEADAEFTQNWENKYKSLDGIWVGTKEEALSQLHYWQQAEQYMPTSPQSDWATVIVDAINTQGNNIVQAIKIILPKSDNTNVDESGYVSAFQTLTQEISNWTLSSGSTPKKFFTDILNGTIGLNADSMNALKMLGMLSSDGSPTFSLADTGIRNDGVAISKDFVIPTRSSDLDYTSKLIPMLEEASRLGASVPRIISAFNDGMRVFELQTRMPGDNIASDKSNKDFLNATDAQIDKLLHTFEVMSKVGLFPDFAGNNILFDENQGFSLVDLDAKQNFHNTDGDPQSMTQGFLKNIYRMGLGKSVFETFSQRVNSRLALPPEQRLVNSDTIIAEQQQEQQATFAKLTPTMDKGAVAEVVKQNVEETPATVKITPVVDNQVDNFDQSKWDKFQQLKQIDMSNAHTRDLQDAKQDMLNLLSLEQQETFANIPFLVHDVDNPDNMFGKLNLDFLKQMESFLAPKNLNMTGVVDSAEQAKVSINGEAQSATDAAKQFVDAAKAKQKFVEANKQVAESADESAAKVTKEAEAAQQAKDTMTATSDNSVQPDNWDKTRQMQTDHGEDPFFMSRSKTDKTNNAFKTITEAWSAVRDEDGELTGEMQLDTVTIINDYKKRTDAITRESEKIKVAQANLRKFLTQFDNKTMGEGKKLTGYTDLLKLSNSDSFGIGDIDKAYAAMSNLDSEYNKVVQSFRKGSSSMNPFVNAINSMGKMEDTLYNVELDFRSLNNQPDDLRNKLIDLYQQFDTLTGETDLYKYAEGFGNLKVAINSVVEAIRQQRKEQNIQTKSATLELDKQASLQTLINMQDKWKQQGLLTDDVRAKIDAMFSSLANITSRDDLGLWIKQWGILKAEVAGAKQAQDSFNAAVKADDKQRSVTEKEYDKLFGDAEKQKANQFTNLIGLRNSYQIKGAKEKDGSKMQLFYAEQQQKVQEQINALSKQVTLSDKEKNNLKEMQLAKERQILEIQQKQAAIASDKANFTSQGNKIDEMYAAGYLSADKYTEWENRLSDFRINKDGLGDKELETKTAELTRMYNQYVKLGNASKAFFNKGGIQDNSNWFLPDQMKNVEQSLRGLYDQVIQGESFEGFKTQITGVNSTLGKLTFTADDCNGSITTYTLAVDKATGATQLLGGQTKAALTPLQRITQSLKKDMTGLAHAFIGGSGVYKFAQYIRNGINSVRELDTALTELKKVTDETEETYDRFLETASETSAKIGSTMRNFTSSTADWARLGYSISDATQLAESTQILMNVSEFTDVSKATDSLISSIQANNCLCV